MYYTQNDVGIQRCRIYKTDTQDTSIHWSWSYLIKDEVAQCRNLSFIVIYVNPLPPFLQSVSNMIVSNNLMYENKLP